MRFFIPLLMICSFAFSLSDDEYMKKMGLDAESIAAIINPYMAKYGQKEGIEKLKADMFQKCEKNNTFKDCFISSISSVLSNFEDRYNNPTAIKHYNKALSIAKNLCDKNSDANSCFDFALLLDDAPMNKNYDFGMAVENREKELKKLVFDYFTKSCNLENMLGCKAVIQMNVYYFDKQDEAIGMAIHYCMIKNQAYFCEELADFNDAYSFDNYANSVLLGNNKYPIVKDAIKYLKQANKIDKKDRSTWFGMLLVKDFQCKDGIKILKENCKKEQAYACVMLGFYHEEAKCLRYDMRKAKEFFGLGCDYGDQIGCNKFKSLVDSGF